MSGPFILVPLTITDAMVFSSTVAEPSPGEALWDAGTSYTLGQEVILTSTHRVYENLIAGIDATSPDIASRQATPRWLNKRATNKWMALDEQVSSQTSVVSPMTYVFRPGFFNAIAVYGMEGATLSVSVKDAPGGTVFFTHTIELIEPPIDYYDYYFGPIRQLTNALIRDILPYADPELTISITAGVGVTVKAGMIVIGDLRSLVTEGALGGALSGAKAKPTTYSYIKADAFGNRVIVPRGGSTNVDVTVYLPIADADPALVTVQECLSKPVAVFISEAPGYSGLNVFGLVSGDVSYEGTNATLNLQVEGIL